MELDIFNKLNESELIKIQQWLALQNDFGNQINKLKGKDNLKKRKKLKEEFNCKCVEFLDELPSKFINSEVFLKYLIKGTHKKLSSDLILTRVPHEILNNDNFMLSVVEYDPYLINNLKPNHPNSKAIYERALANNGNAIQFIPTNEITLELAEMAVKNNAMALQHLPNDLKTEHICLLAIEKNIEVVNFVPWNYLRDFTFAKRSCMRNILFWKNLPKPTKYDRHIIHYCLEKCGVTGMDSKENLYELPDFLKQLYTNIDSFTTMLILSYVKREVILKFAISEIASEKAHLHNFRLLKEVDRDDLYQEIVNKVGNKSAN